MNIQASTRSLRETDAPALVVTVFKDEKADAAGLLQELDSLSGGVVRSIFEGEEIKGKEGETAFVHLAPNENLRASRLLLVGAGAKDEYNAAKVANVAGTAARFLRSKGVKSFAFAPRCDADDAVLVAQTAAQGAITSLFELDKYRTKDREERIIEGFTLVVENGDEAALNRGVERGKIIGDSMNFTRELSNEPGNFLTPTEMARRAQAMAQETGLKCEIFEEADCEKMGMGSFLSVARGSEEPAKFIVLRYEPNGNASNQNGKYLALVGKGITFDTGGISLKDPEGMDAMKYDMTGGGTVLGTMRAIALLKPSIPVLGIVAATENMPDGKATKPGDIVRAMNGKTIEVLNTDAEGRLVLADAVAYAKEQGATDIIDMATLTGAVIIALGDINTAVLGDQPLVDEIIESGKEVGEKFWQLPLDKEYFELIKSPTADIKNIGTGRKAGTIIGAAFIKEFAEDVNWAHLDIAGTAWNDSERPFRSKGPSGVAIRTLINIVEKRAGGQ
jgi:leucyl aminopeptidase